MRRAAAVVASLLLGAACSASGDAAPTTTSTTESPTTSTTYADLYAPPDDVPTTHGTLLRHEVVKQGAPDSGVLERVLYSSTSPAGEPIAVSGLVAWPTGTPPDGGWPIVTWAHGTTGIADSCAPSMFPASYFTKVATAFIARGFAMVGTDYEGLGTPGRHPYLDGESEGRGVLDIVSAARQIKAASLGDRYAIFGHSQGGHAAVFASELAASWLPDLELVGTVAAAPVSELTLISDALVRNSLRGFGVMLIAGINAAHPEARLEQVVTPVAIERMDVVDTGCTQAVFAAYSDLGDNDFLVAKLHETEPWKRLLEADDPGHRTSDAPLLIVHGASDALIPPLLSELLFKRLCGLGQVVDRRTYEGADHGGVLAAAAGDIDTWLTDRFAGAPAASTCA